MQGKRVAFHNLGCKVNAYETDVMIQLLQENGYELVDFEEEADVYIVNTCTVTNIADRKSRQMLHRARKKNPAAVVVAVGCYVQTGLEQVLKEEGINLVIGNNKKADLVKLLSDYLSLPVEERDKEQAKTLNGETVDALESINSCESMQLKRIEGHTRAYIKIQDGCNQYCTYCIIPRARGWVRSRDEAEILAEVKGLAEEGIREFVLTGIHISSYGCDIEEPGRKLAFSRFYEKYLLGLIGKMEEIAGVERIRLSSLEPRIVTEAFTEGLKQHPKVCPHFHLSLQSGSDTVLRRMNRHYRTEEFAQGVERLRKIYKDPAITTDVIVGFPAETEEEFAESLAFAERIGFYEMHIFKYSKRKGTSAAIMKGQLTEAEKAARSDRMEALERKMTETFVKRWIGRDAEVLFEEQKEIDGRCYQVGHSREYLHIAVETGEALSGQIRRVRIGEKELSGSYIEAVLE